MNAKELLEKATEARLNAYAPYSDFKVGAALLCKSGKIYLGCNVENAAFSVTNCAERTAFFSAIAAGEREFVAIAVVGGKGDSPSGECAPCGVCRQVMAEFCDGDFLVLLGSSEQYETYPLSKLLPLAFSSGQITAR